MPTIALEEAQAKLAELIERLSPGEALVIIHDEKPVARLLAEEPPKRKPRQPGNCKGMLTIVATDSEHLRGFEQYMR